MTYEELRKVYTTYDEDGECPFCKRRREDKPARKTKG